MSNKKPIAVKAKKDGFMSEGGPQFCKKGKTYPIVNQYSTHGFTISTMESKNHHWNSKMPDFGKYFEIIYGEHKEPKINLQVDKTELGLLFKLVNGNSLSPAEKRELYDLRSHIEKLLK